MDPHTDNRSGHEQSLDRLITEYYQAAERGSPLDKAALIAEHPEFATELREFFSAIGHIDAAVPKAAPQDFPVETLDANQRQRHVTSGPLVRYFGDYEILEELGAGGMGVVYKARQQSLKRTVALKMIKVGNLAGESEIQRFQAEARAAAKLDHPSIVSVLEVGIQDGQRFFTMDYVAGGSLSKLHRDQPLAGKRAAEIVKQLAEAVNYAHGQGIVHRDLKPANVLLTTTGIPRITDFGLAKQVGDDGASQMSLTESGQILGTAGYMSPEQAAGKTRLVGPPADIYSLGAILYALLTGRAPFVGESQADTIMQVLNRDPVSPRTLNPSIPRDLETIALKCLEKEPYKRYGTAQLLADDLVRFANGQPVLARPLSPPARLWRWCCRNPWAATALSLLVLFAVVSPPVAYQQFHQRQEIGKQKSDLEKSGKRIARLLDTETALRSRAQADARELGQQKSAIEELLGSKEAALSRATLAEQEAHAARNLAESEAAAKSKTLYVSDMQRMGALWQEANLRTMRVMLGRHVPAAGKPDLRDFEWHYWNHKCNEARRQWKHGASVNHLAISADGNWLAGAASEAPERTTIAIWNLKTGALERTSDPVPFAIEAIQFTRTAEVLLVVRRSIADPFSWNWKTSEVSPSQDLARRPLGQIVCRCVFSHAADLYASSSGFGVICKRWPSNKSLEIPIADDPDVTERWRKKSHVVYSGSNGQWVEFRGDVAGVVRMRDRDSIRDIPISMPGLDARDPNGGRSWSVHDELAPSAEEDGGPVFSLDFSPNQGRLAAGSRDGELLLWELSTGAELLRIAAHEDLIWDIAISPDEKTLATASKDGLIKLWSLPDGKLSATLAGHRGAVRTLDFSSSGLLASAGDDQSVRLWSASSGLALHAFWGHEATVRDVKFLPDGLTVVSAAADGTIREWSTADIDRPLVIADGTSLESVDLFSGGKRVAASGYSNEVTVWDIVTGQTTATLRGQREPCYHLRVAPDDSTVTAATWDGTFSCWDVATGKLLWQRKLPIIPNIHLMPHVSISGDARYVAAMVPQDARARVFDLKTPDQEPIVVGKSLRSTGYILISPDGSQVLRITPVWDAVNKKTLPGEVNLWNATTGALVATLDQNTIGNTAAFARDGRKVAWCKQVSQEGEPYRCEVIVWDAETQHIFQRLGPLPEMIGVKSLAFSPDGSQLAAVSPAVRATRTNPATAPLLIVWELDFGRERFRLREAGSAVSFTADGRQVVVAGAGRVNFFDAAHGEKQRTLTRPIGPAVSLAYSQQGRKIKVVSHSPARAGLVSRQNVFETTVALDDPLNPEQRMFAQYGELSKRSYVSLPDGSFYPRGLLWRKFSQDPNALARFGISDSPLRQRDSRGVESLISTERLAAYAPQAGYAFIVTATGALVRGAVDGRHEIAAAEQAISAGQTCQEIACSTDGRWVAIALGQTIELWNGQTLKHRRTLHGHEAFVRCIAFSPDCSQLASGASDRTVRLWQTADESPHRTLLGHSQGVTCVAFSKRGRTVASSGRDGTIQLWDAETGESKTTLMGHAGPVHWIEFSPDGSELASAGEDGEVRIWKAPGAVVLSQIANGLLHQD